MKKSIFNIGTLLSVVAVGLLAMTSCEKDDKSNPTFQQPSAFHLNTPALANSSNVYDLSKAASVNLTCNQPSYGMPLKTTYQVQVSIDPRFSQEDVDGVKYSTLKSTYTTANMLVDATEMNNAVVKLYQAANDGADPSGIEMPVYVRLRAHVGVESNKLGYLNSNVITLPRAVVSFVATVPTEIYMRGSSIRGGEKAKKLGQVVGSVTETGADYVGLFYAAAGSSFTWGDDDSAANGYSSITSLSDYANATVSADADGGVQIANAGWYGIHFVCSIDKKLNQAFTTVEIYEPAAYVIGGGAGGDWTDANSDWKMTMPEDATGNWVSPAFTGSGELRAYVKIPGIDWWKTEFTLYKGGIVWREKFDIPANWAENVGAAYSVAVAPGQKLYMDFDNDSGKVE